MLNVNHILLQMKDVQQDCAKFHKYKLFSFIPLSPYVSENTCLLVKTNQQPFLKWLKGMPYSFISMPKTFTHKGNNKGIIDAKSNKERYENWCYA